MQLSAKCKYGMQAMIEIGRRYKSGPINRKEIIKTKSISQAYLENILISLKANNLIRTVRGANGGFSLVKPASAINLLDIVTTLEGTISPIECLENYSLCEKTSYCTVRKAWGKLYEAQKNVLSGISLQDLLEADAHESADDYVI